MDDVDTQAAVYQAVTDVRIGMFSRIGKTRALEISTLAFSENPTTDDEVLRSKAISAESLWVTLLLMQRLPVLFMDNTSIRDNFNDEPITRDSSSLRKNIDAIQTQLDDLIGDLILEGDEEAKPAFRTKVALNGPDTPYLLSDNFLGYPSNAY